MEGTESAAPAPTPGPEAPSSAAPSSFEGFFETALSQSDSEGAPETTPEPAEAHADSAPDAAETLKESPAPEKDDALQGDDQKKAEAPETPEAQVVKGFTVDAKKYRQVFAAHPELRHVAYTMEALGKLGATVPEVRQFKERFPAGIEDADRTVAAAREFYGLSEVLENKPALLFEHFAKEKPEVHSRVVDAVLSNLPAERVMAQRVEAIDLFTDNARVFAQRVRQEDPEYADRIEAAAEVFESILHPQGRPQKSAPARPANDPLTRELEQLRAEKNQREQQRATEFVSGVQQDVVAQATATLEKLIAEKADGYPPRLRAQIAAETRDDVLATLKALPGYGQEFERLLASGPRDQAHKAKVVEFVMSRIGKAIPVSFAKVNEAWAKEFLPAQKAKQEQLAKVISKRDVGAGAAVTGAGPSPKAKPRNLEDSFLSTLT